MTSSEKARQAAEEIAKQIVADDFLDRTVQQAENEIADALAKALLQFAQEQESEAVRELVVALEPFARSINEELADEKALYVSLDDVYLRVGPTVGHCRKAAALIARHSKGAV